MRHKRRAFQKPLTYLTITACAIATSSVAAQEYAVISGGQTLNCSIATPAGPKPVPQSVEMILRVDLTHGARSIISTKTCDESLNKSDSGWGGITGFAIDSSRRILVAGGSAIYRIDATTGTSKLVSDFSDPNQGLLPGGIIDLAIGPTGNLYASSVSTVNFLRDKLISVDPATGNRTVISDGRVSSQGSANASIRSLAVAPTTGLIFVTGLIDNRTNTNPYPSFLFTIDPVTGFRTGISSPYDPAQGTWGTGAYGHGVSGIAVNDDGGDGPGVNPIALDVSGRIYAIVPAGTDSHAMLVSIDNSTGVRTPLSDFGNGTQGPIIDNPIALKVSASGPLLVLDDGRPNTIGALLAIDPLSGTRRIISDFSNTDQGPTPGIVGGSVTAMEVGDIPESRSGSGGEGTAEITFTASSSTVQLGQSIVYTLTFSNDGPTTASEVRLSDKLPQKLKWLSTTPTTGTCKGKSSITCNFGAVGAGEKVSVTITVLTRRPGVIRNKVIVNYKTPKIAGSAKLKTHSQTATAQASVTK